MHVLKGRFYQIGVALLLASLLVLLLAPIAQSQRAVKCFGKTATIVGTSGPDTIPGTFGRDVIAGLGGTDTIRGDADFFGAGVSGGSDFICANSGDDNGLVDGGDRKDFINGGSGDDTLDGDNFETVFGDLLIGEDGDDTFTGGPGDDTIEGGPGDDQIGVGTQANDGSDKDNAGPGDDMVNEAGDGSNDMIDCGAGEDTAIIDRGENQNNGNKDNVKHCETVTRLIPSQQVEFSDAVDNLPDDATFEDVLAAANEIANN